jgi:sulfoacetaldehyde acetyltransferase
VTAVVFNNGSGARRRRTRSISTTPAFVGVNLKNPSWAEVARSLGADGVTIDKLDDVGEALDKACDAQKEAARRR